jgi:ATP phosphoribosyltransferase regulatory subunit
MALAILPNGLRDLLPREAYTYRAITARVMGVFESFGYNQVKPPLAEYDTTLFEGKGDHARTNSFQMPDPVSGKTLAIRSDMTIQTSRIARHMMQTEALPLRISYMGDVLRIQSESTSDARQLSQAGLELIGVQNRESEIVSALIESLDIIGLRDIVIDFHSAGLLARIVGASPVSDAQKSAILNAIQNKEEAALPDNLPCKDILKLLQQTGDAKLLLQQFSTSPLTTEIKDMLTTLTEVITDVECHYPSISLSLDLLDTTGFEYHDGICFSVFLKHSGQEIARGGSYWIEDAEGTNHPATGATLYVHRLLDAVTISNDKPRIYIATDANYSKAQELRKSGYITLHGSYKSATSEARAEAAALRCENILSHNEILPLAS